MGYLSGFDHDIFVSYAHRDIERKLAGSGPTWTRQVVEILTSLIEENLGISGTDRRLDVYQDIFSHEKDRDTADILKAVAASGILLVFISRKFMGSKWFVDEATKYKLQQPPRWPDDPGKTGIFLIEIEETSRDDWPDCLKDAAGNPQIALPLHHRPDQAAASQTLGFPNIAKSEHAGEVYELLANLAIQMGKSLQCLECSHPAKAIEGASSRPHCDVYLGYTTKERRPERQALMQLLSGMDLRLCPEASLSDFADPEALRRQVAADLGRSRLAIQLLSDNNGTHELTTTQIDLARAAGLPLVLWRPQALDVDALDVDAFGYRSYRERFREYISIAETGPLETLAERVADQLREPPSDDVEVQPWRVDWPTILVFSGNLAGYRFALSELDPRLDKLIDDTQWHVVYPGPEVNSPKELMRFYERHIKACDAVIVIRCEEEAAVVAEALQDLAGEKSQRPAPPAAVTAQQEEESVLETINTLGLRFQQRRPGHDFYVGVVYGPPPGMKISLGNRARVFDCSERHADQNLYLWLKKLRDRITNPPDRTT